MAVPCVACHDTATMLLAHESSRGRIAVLDSLTHCDGRLGALDVVVAGSFAGGLAFAFALPFGVRGLIAHEAGVGRNRAGIAGLALAERFAVPAAAVETMSARLGDGASVLEYGVVAHVNDEAEALGVTRGMPAREAALRLLEAPPGRIVPGLDLVDRSHRVAERGAGGRIVLAGSTSFAVPGNGADVFCTGSHGGRVNTGPLVAVRPRGVIVNDGGFARDRSGVDGLPVLDEAGVAAASVGTMSARIGDPESTWETGEISALNATAAKLGVEIGQAASEAARRMLAGVTGEPV